MKNRIFACLLTFVALGAAAVEKTWVGGNDDRPNRWDSTTYNWNVDNVLTNWAFYEVARFDDTAQTREVYFDSNMNASGIVVNADSDYLFYRSETAATGKKYVSGLPYFTFTKTGSGTVLVTNSIFKTTGAGFFINGGTLEFNGMNILLSTRAEPNGGFHVGQGGELRFSFRNPFGSGTDSCVTTPITVTNGTLTMNFGSSGHIIYGPLSFYDATFDYKKPHGYGAYPNAVGIMTLSGRVDIDGTTPFELTPEHAYSSDMFIHLWNEPNTEFHVAPITGGTGADFTLGLRTVDRFNNAKGVSALQSSGFVKTGAGSMVVTNINNDFTGDIEVREGSLCVSAFDRSLRRGGANYLGSFLSGNRTVTVYTNATLNLYANWGLSSASIYRPQPITNNCFKGTFVFDGGELKRLNESTLTLPNLTVGNGAKVGGTYGRKDLYGCTMVQDTIRVTGKIPFVWAALNRKNYRYEWNALVLNGYPENTFDVEDVTGDGEVDATFDIPFCICSAFFTAGYTLDDWSFGFTKTGAGTMRMTAESVDVTTNSCHTCTYNGDTKVNDGTLQIDGDISLSDTVRVADGAYLAGTGTVNNVALSAGAGLKATRDAAGVLKVKGSLEFAGAPKIAITDDTQTHRVGCKVSLLEVDGTVTGTEHLKNAQVTYNGEVQKFEVSFIGKRLVARRMVGFILMVK